MVTENYVLSLFIVCSHRPWLTAANYDAGRPILKASVHGQVANYNVGRPILKASMAIIFIARLNNFVDFRLKRTLD